MCVYIQYNTVCVFIIEIHRIYIRNTEKFESLTYNKK